MKKSVLKIVLLLAVPVAFFAVRAASSPSSALFDNAVAAANRQGSDLDARLQSVERRIAVLKQSVATNPKFKQYRGSLATLENKKNTLKAQLKTAPKDNAARPNLEKDVKALEDKVSELEGQVK